MKWLQKQNGKATRDNNETATTLPSLARIPTLGGLGTELCLQIGKPLCGPLAAKLGTFEFIGQPIHGFSSGVVLMLRLRESTKISRLFEIWRKFHPSLKDR
jgi:hypothetical protein